MTFMCVCANGGPMFIKVYIYIYIYMLSKDQEFTLYIFAILLSYFHIPSFLLTDASHSDFLWVITFI